MSDAATNPPEDSIGPSPLLDGLFALLTFALPLAVMLYLYRSCLPAFTEDVPMGAFNQSHVWVFDHIVRMVMGERPLSEFTEFLAFPTGAIAHPLAIAPALMVLPINRLLGPVAAYNTALFLSPSLSALSTYFLFRKLVQARPAAAAAAAISVALTPFMLGTLVSGQIAKAQLWILTLPPLGLTLAMAGPRRLLGILIFGLSCLAGAFTSPSLMVQLPFILAPTGIYLLMTRPGRIKALLMGFLAVAILAGAAIPAAYFYKDAARFAIITPVGVPIEDYTGPIPAFFSANRSKDPQRVAQMIARPDTLLQPNYPYSDAWGSTAHITFLPWPALLFALLLMWRRKWGQALGLTILTAGVVMAMGEYLFVGDAPFRYNGELIRLPAVWLWHLHYPAGASGAYYRFMATAALGLGLLLAVGGSHNKWTQGGVWLSVVLSLGLTIYWTGELWPQRPYYNPSKGIEATLAADPLPGAVLDLPITTQGIPDPNLMKSAALHGRPIWSAPRPMDQIRTPGVITLNIAVFRALKGEDARATLQKMGIAFVILNDSFNSQIYTKELLKSALGAPLLTRGPKRVWRLSDEDLQKEQ